MELRNKICCFFGHRKIFEQENLLKLLVKQINFMISHHDVNTFLFGGYGDFDDMCKKAVDSLKQEYPYIKSVFVQAYYKHNDKDFIGHIRNSYDEVIYPEIGELPKKFAITYRNQTMINMSDYCLFYVKRSYGGAYQTLCYAKRRNKSIFNFAAFF